MIQTVKNVFEKMPTTSHFPTSVVWCLLRLLELIVCDPPPIHIFGQGAEWRTILTGMLASRRNAIFVSSGSLKTIKERWGLLCLFPALVTLEDAQHFQVAIKDLCSGKYLRGNEESAVVLSSFPAESMWIPERSRDGSWTFTDVASRRMLQVESTGRISLGYPYKKIEQFRLERYSGALKKCSTNIF